MLINIIDSFKEIVNLQALKSGTTLRQKHLENNSEKFPELVREDDGDNRQLLFIILP